MKKFDKSRVIVIGVRFYKKLNAKLEFGLAEDIVHFEQLNQHE